MVRFHGRSRLACQARRDGVGSPATQGTKAQGDHDAETSPLHHGRSRQGAQDQPDKGRTATYRTLSDTTIACLRYWLKAQPTVFRAIFWYEPLDAEEGAPGWLYPVPPELLGTFDPKQVRENLCINLDPRKMKLVHEGKP